MATANDSEAQGCTFRWKIENAIHWFWLNEGEGVVSPVFTSDALGGAEWRLWFCTTDSENESVSIELQREKNCSGPDIIEATCQVALLGKDGSILKESTAFKRAFSKESRCLFADFEQREKVLFTDREKFLPEDTLTVQCNVWTTDRKPNNLKKCAATTVIKVKRRNLVWRIDKVSDFETDKRNEFWDYLFACDLKLYKKSDRLSVDLYDLDEIVNYVSCTVSLIDSEDRKQTCGIRKYYDVENEPLLYELSIFSDNLMENKERYFPQDVLCLDFEFVLVTVEDFDDRENLALLENGSLVSYASQGTKLRPEDVYSLLNDNPPNGEVITDTGTIPVYKEILIDNNPVFEAMFTQDGSQIEILGFDHDTVNKMLTFIQSASLDKEEPDSLLKLYKIATEYRVMSLKNECYSQFRKILDKTNVCDILVKADEHDVVDLRRVAEDYILRNSKEIFCSEEWVKFLKTHLKLGANIMYKKITKRDFHFPSKT